MTKLDARKTQLKSYGIHNTPPMRCECGYLFLKWTPRKWCWCGVPPHGHPHPLYDWFISCFFFYCFFFTPITQVINTPFFFGADRSVWWWWCNVLDDICQVWKQHEQSIMVCESERFSCLVARKWLNFNFFKV